VPLCDVGGMSKPPGARELELRAQRERQWAERERAKKAQPPPTKPPSTATAKGVTGEARRAAPMTGTLPIGAAPNIRDDQMLVVTERFFGLRTRQDGPPCVRCDLPMLRNPQSKSKSFGRAWLCAVCDSDKLPTAPSVDNGTDVVDEAAPQEEEIEVAKKKLKKAAKMAKKVKAKKQTAKVIKKVKADVKAKVKNGVGRPKGHAADSIEAAAPWDKEGISRRTWYRRQLAAK
jgi:hypothetical protein